MTNFNRYTSVLTEGFTARDATPPNQPASVKEIRTIGIKKPITR